MSGGSGGRFSGAATIASNKGKTQEVPVIKSMAYKDTGVDYDSMDPAKRIFQMAAAQTSSDQALFDIKPLEWTRGESVYVVKMGDEYIGHVEEGLGSKNVVADDFAEQLITAMVIHSATGRSYYEKIAQCAVAMIANDMSTLNISPISIAMHLAAGHKSFFDDMNRMTDLANGWKKACEQAGAIWGPGESSTLRDVVYPKRVVLGGSAWGRAFWRLVLNPESIQDGDGIILVKSSGVHANGITLTRDIAAKLPEGYLTLLPAQKIEGEVREVLPRRMYGEELLRPTIIYSKLVEALVKCNIKLRYCVNITGHGWRKLMRAKQPFAYVVKRAPEIPPIFRFIMEHGPVTTRDAYADLNMGAGYALYVARKDVEKAVDIINSFPEFSALDAGYIEAAQEASVHIMQHDLTFTRDALNLR